MAGQTKERFVEKMAEGDDDENAAECDQRFANAQPNEKQRAAGQLDERDCYPNQPKRPNGQEGVAKRPEVFSGVLQRA